MNLLEFPSLRFWRWCLRYSIAAVLFAAGGPLPSTAARELDASQECLELIVQNAGRLERWEIEVRLGTNTVAERWETAFARCFAFADLDNDGLLTLPESERLPAVFTLRQILWGRFLTNPGHAPPFERLDADRNERVSLSELRDYYRSAGVGRVWGAVAVAPNSRSLTAAIVTSPDLPTGVKNESEWLARVKRLSEFDRDGDALITASELRAEISYPGAAPTCYLDAPSFGKKVRAEIAELPLTVLPLGESDTYWAEEIIARWDRNDDGNLSSDEMTWAPDTLKKLDSSVDGRVHREELAQWRNHPPDLKISVDLNPSGARALEFRPEHPTVQAEGATATQTWNGLSFYWRADQGRLQETWQRFQTRTRTQFQQEAGAANQVAIDQLKALPKSLELFHLAQIADRDSDKNLTDKELEYWLQFMQAQVDAQVLLSIIDYDTGLFEFLDLNHNGALSESELRDAWPRFEQAGLVTETGLQWNRVPRQLHLTLSHGLPPNPLARRGAVGPSWFVAMDRNGDGQITRQEFVGDEPRFRKLDLNGDDRIDAKEAAH